MIAGGIGNIAAAHAHKVPIPDGAPPIQLGGPGMLIGMGGGAASSMATGANTQPISISIRFSAATPRSSAVRRR